MTKKIMCIAVALGLILCTAKSVKAAVSSVYAGDANADGYITASDARLVLRAIVGLSAPGLDIIGADVDGDWVLTAADARIILRRSVGIGTVKTSGAVLVGCTKTGYDVYLLNGVTYIDNIIIANKTYSVPKAYAPGGLTYYTNKVFEEMKNDAKKQGLVLYNASGYRSYSQQSSIYSRYVNKNGKAMADRFSARPGYSEHQTGLAIDLNTISASFANTKEGKWIAENCYKYGFILRYPKGKEGVTGYMYEPWHIRFVGVEIANKIYKSGLTLEEYYGITSAYAQ